MITVFLVFEIVGTIAFALSGALVAHRLRMDALGVCVLGLVTAVGGGTLRDLMLGVTPPVSLAEPIFSLLSIGVSLFTLLPFMQRFLAHKHKIYDRILLLARYDNLGKGASGAALQCMNIVLGNDEAEGLIL